MTEEAVDCSVLVPVLDEERYIAGTVAAMRAQRFDGAIEFIFADGGSTDRTRALLEQEAGADPRIRVYDNSRRTVSSGLNVALGHARGRWVARMDAHTRYPDDYVALGVRRLRQGGTAWVSGPPLPEGHGRVSRAVALALGTDLGRSGSLKWTASLDRDAPEYDLDTGVFCGVWERERLLACGGWDERWRVNEDSEMASRFLARGERLVCVPAMAATYVPRDALPGLWRQYRVYGTYRARTAQRHPSSMRRQHLAAPALVAAAAGSAAPGRAAPLRAGRVAARGAMGAYALSLARTGMRAREHAGSAGEAALVPVVLATMHLAWGVGTWIGMARYGPPDAGAVWATLTGQGDARRGSDTGPDAVYNPSL